MMRRLSTAALALSFAGGVYLAGAPAQASNMGFKLERDINVVRNAGGNPLKNVYWIATPYFNGMADLANSAATLPPTTTENACVGEANAPAVGDGTIDSDDAMCDWWTSRLTNPGAPAGTFSLTWFNRSDCIPKTRNATFRLGEVFFTGEVFDLTTSRGYQVNMVAPTGQSPANRAIIVGSHDPSFPGQIISATPVPPACTPGPGVVCCAASASQRDILNVPYHSMLETSLELLCGLEGTAWDDDGEDENNVAAGTAGDGYPDHLNECDTSIFDGVHTIAVSTFVNDTIINGEVTCAVSNRIGAISFSGCPASQIFTLQPGNGYKVNILATHNPPTTFLSPHF